MSTIVLTDITILDLYEWLRTEPPPCHELQRHASAEYREAEAESPVLSAVDELAHVGARRSNERDIKGCTSQAHDAKDDRAPLVPMYEMQECSKKSRDQNP